MRNWQSSFAWLVALARPIYHRKGKKLELRTVFRKNLVNPELMFETLGPEGSAQNRELE